MARNKSAIQGIPRTTPAGGRTMGRPWTVWQRLKSIWEESHVGAGPLPAHLGLAASYSHDDQRGFAYLRPQSTHRMKVKNPLAKP